MEYLSVNQRIELLRNTLNLTIKALSEAINVSPSTMSGLINKQSDVGFSVLHAILTTYDTVSPDWLMLGKGDMFRRSEAVSPTNNVINSTFTGQTTIAHTVTINNGAPSPELMGDELANLRRENISLLEINRQLQEQNQMLTKKI